MKAHGKGFAAAVPADIFSSYKRHNCLPEARRFMGRVLKRLMPERAIEIEAPTVIEIIFRRKTKNFTFISATAARELHSARNAA